MLKKLAMLSLLALSLGGYVVAADGAENASVIQPLLIGASAPDAGLSSPDGEETTLHQLIDGKKSVVIFYRGSW